MRLIDADKFDEKYIEIKVGNGFAEDEEISAKDVAYFQALALDALPTIDAVPVVHGEWINEEIDVGYNFAEYRYTCSNCGAKTEFVRYPTTKFCPHCGAKMDAERNVDE